MTTELNEAPENNLAPEANDPTPDPAPETLYAIRAGGSWRGPLTTDHLASEVGERLLDPAKYARVLNGAAKGTDRRVGSSRTSTCGPRPDSRGWAYSRRRQGSP